MSRVQCSDFSPNPSAFFSQCGLGMRDSYRLLKGVTMYRPQKRSETKTRKTPKMRRLTREDFLVAAMMSELRLKISGSVLYARWPARAKGSPASATKKTAASAQRKVEAKTIGT